jgi:hypothetical protein
MKNKIILIIASVLLLFIGAVFTGFYLYNKKPADLRDSKPDVIIACTDLLDQYDSDSQKADSAYMNRIIQVEGTVVGISTDPDGVTSINLSDDKHAIMVSCEMTQEFQPGSSGIDTGSQVTIKGQCCGMLMDIILVKCVLIK